MSNFSESENPTPQSIVEKLNKDLKPLLEINALKLLLLEKLKKEILEKRASIVIKALNSLGTLQKNLESIQPKVVYVIPETGEPIKGLSQEDLKKKEKLNQKLNRLQQLLEEAFSYNTEQAFDKLEKELNKSDS